MLPHEGQARPYESKTPPHSQSVGASQSSSGIHIFRFGHRLQYRPSAPTNDGYANRPSKVRSQDGHFTWYTSNPLIVFFSLISITSRISGTRQSRQAHPDTRLPVDPASSHTDSGQRGGFRSSDQGSVSFRAIAVTVFSPREIVCTACQGTFVSDVVSLIPERPYFTLLRLSVANGKPLCQF